MTELMKQEYYLSKAIVATLGRFDSLLCTFFIFVVVNIITTIIASILKRERLGRIVFEILLQKFTEFLIIIIVNTLFWSIECVNTFRILIITFYIANEGLEILSNSYDIGIPIPPKLKQVLKHLLHKTDREKKKR